MRLLIVFILLCLGKVGLAQITLNRIPLEEEITINILGNDSKLLACYNLYGYEYDDEGTVVSGEFIVRKDKDVYKELKETTIKFCRIKEFFIYVNSACQPIKTPSGINIKGTPEEDLIYFNFDPDGPDPVFMPCK